MAASSYTQGTSALFSIDTPLGTDKLLLQGFKGSEGISRLFHFDLNLLSEDSNIDFTKIIGQTVTITLNPAAGTPRYLCGVISRFGQGGSGQTFTSYYAEMVPWLWFLTRNADCQIFQSMKVPDIISKVFNDLGYKDHIDKTGGTYDSLDYCVQYRESSFNFVSRLMEEYGIFYYFQHEQGKHTLVLADPSANIPDCPVQSEFQVEVDNVANADYDVITGWRSEREMRTGKYTLTDYNFETPSTNLLATVSTIDTVGGNSGLETFDYPGKYTTKNDGATLVKTRMEEEESLYNVSRGSSNARSMVSGYKFTLKNYYRNDANIAYLLTDIEHNASTDTYSSGGGRVGDRYSNAFRCIPASVSYRPLRVTPRPVVYGPQTAVVVGNQGDEICVDNYGRIKVQFFWDRKGQKNASSSCWIRVSHLFAGKGWGAVFTPRVGQEVIVDFLEGDPDQPLITGRLYNADQMPHDTLPANMNYSGIISRSTKDGAADNFNVFQYDDTKGSEILWLGAEKDMKLTAKNDQEIDVKNDQIINITQNRTETVSKGNETVTISNGTRTHTVYGNETLEVQSGNRVVKIDQGNDAHTISQGNRTVTISAGNDTLKISQGNLTISASAGTISVTAAQSITFTCGESSIALSPSGITITATQVTISAQMSCTISAGVGMTITGGVSVTISAGATMSVTAGAMLSLSGTMTSINS